jgi:hypothetical protein
VLTYNRHAAQLSKFAIADRLWDMDRYSEAVVTEMLSAHLAPTTSRSDQVAPSHLNTGSGEEDAQRARQGLSAPAEEESELADYSPRILVAVRPHRHR